MVFYGLKFKFVIILKSSWRDSEILVLFSLIFATELSCGGARTTSVEYVY